MPIKVIPILTTDIINAPISVLRTLPTPPVIAVPPIITAAIDGNNNPVANVGEPLVNLPDNMTPAKPAKQADKPQATIL